MDILLFLHMTTTTTGLEKEYKFIKARPKYLEENNTCTIYDFWPPTKKRFNKYIGAK